MIHVWNTRTHVRLYGVLRRSRFLNIFFRTTFQSCVTERPFVRFPKRFVLLSAVKRARSNITHLLRPVLPLCTYISHCQTPMAHGEEHPKRFGRAHTNESRFSGHNAIQDSRDAYRSVALKRKPQTNAVPCTDRSQTPDDLSSRRNPCSIRYRLRGVTRRRRTVRCSQR